MLPYSHGPDTLQAHELLLNVKAAAQRGQCACGVIPYRDLEAKVSHFWGSWLLHSAYNDRSVSR